MLVNVSDKIENVMSNYKQKDELRRYEQPAPLAPIQC
jgi:hypothetical protein